MKNLSSRQKELVTAMLEKLAKRETIEINEPCNCGGQTRHNNGGNYHEYFVARMDEGKWYSKIGNTSDWDDAKWEETSKEAVVKYVTDHADWL